MQPDRNVPPRDNPKEQAKNGANLTPLPPVPGVSAPVNFPRPVAAVLLSAASLVALAVPAGAAVPKRPADQTFPCNDGSGKAAQVWQWSGHLAAKNPCSTEWLFVTYGSQFYNSAFDSAMGLAPGAHFNWDRKQLVKYLGGEPNGYWRMGANECDSTNEGGPTLWVYSYKDVRTPYDASAPTDC